MAKGGTQGVGTGCHKARKGKKNLCFPRLYPQSLGIRVMVVEARYPSQLLVKWVLSFLKRTVRTALQISTSP